jgi:hypothetical protein
VSIVNPFNFADDVQELLVDPSNWDYVPTVGETHEKLPAGSFLKVKDLMPAGIAALIRQVVRAHEWQAAGLDGFANKPFEKVGSYRLSTMNNALAELLWSRLERHIPNVRIMDECTPTDHEGHYAWKAVGVSPLFRFIRYKRDGQLVGHYDATYKESDTRRTLMSVVIYLTPNERGATRFLIDPQAGRPMELMDFSDWDRAGNLNEILFRVAPEIGHALVFDHRLLHDSEPLGEDDPEKIIIRTDIMFEKV